MQFKILEKFLKYSISKNKEEVVTLNRELFFKILTAAVKSNVNFDRAYYEARYPDVLRGIKKETVNSSEEHYYYTGYQENRVPNKILINEEYYLKNNPDVEAAVRSGEVSSAQEHFEASGFSEGRAPYLGFNLFLS